MKYMFVYSCVYFFARPMTLLIISAIRKCMILITSNRNKLNYYTKAGTEKRKKRKKKKPRAIINIGFN